MMKNINKFSLLDGEFQADAVVVKAVEDVKQGFNVRNPPLKCAKP